MSAFSPHINTPAASAATSARARVHYAPMDQSDEQLMLAWRGGDAAAFAQIYSRHKGGVLRYLLRQTGKREWAEELFQDVWLKVVNARSGYEARARFSAWLYSIAHNRLMDHFREHARASLVSYEDETGLAEAQPAAAYEQPERMLQRKQEARDLLRLLDALPAAQREAFVLQQEGELSVEEIAAATGVNRETAKSRLRYALAKLRMELGKLS
jgi:RNA polymerase sigma-70 factor (ECF subfamily)